MTKTPMLVYIYGSLIAFVWEIYQMPLFEPGGLSPYQQTVRCGIASLGDGLILLAGYGLARLKGGADWPFHSRPVPFSIYFAFGLVIAVVVELLATFSPQGSLLSWRYSELMPLIPLTGLALAPIAMWIIVPALTIGLLRFFRHANGRR